MDQTIVLEIIKPILYAILAAAATVVGIYVKKIGNEVIAWVQAKVGSANFDAALEVAQGLYIYLEDKYGDAFKQMGDTKKAEMEAMLMDKFPTLTQAELDSINKIVWYNFQEGYNGTYVKESLPTQALKEESERVDG